MRSTSLLVKIGTVFDQEMQIFNSGSRERTGAEYRVLFEAAGLQLKRIIPTPSLFL